MRTILDIIRALKIIGQFIEWWETFVLKKRGQASEDKAQKGSDALNEANKIEDDAERLKKKAEAVKDYEDAVRGG